MNKTYDELVIKYQVTNGKIEMIERLIVELNSELIKLYNRKDKIKDEISQVVKTEADDLCRR